MKKKWTKEDDDFIIEHFKEISIKEISKKLQRTENSIHLRASFLGLTQKRSAGWTEEEVKLLHTDRPIVEIARMIGRSVSAVNKKRAIERSKIKYYEYIDTSAIERNVPLIDRFSRSSQYLAMLQKMNVDESFEYPKNEHSILRNQILMIHDKKFITKKWTEDTRRCWCVEVLINSE